MQSEQCRARQSLCCSRSTAAHRRDSIDPLTIALGLSQFVPKIVQWIGGDKAGAVAQKVISIAQQVTGKPTGDQALEALKADPSLVLQFQQAVMAQETAFNQMAVQNAADVNKSMQVEAAAEHWPTYSWRPAIGFATAFTITAVAAVVMIAYAGVILANKSPAPLAYIPGMIGAVAALLAGGAMPVLGIASWYRGRMQADPNIPTVNRG